MGTGNQSVFDDTARFIRRGKPEGFNALALRIFKFQYQNNPAYGAFCRGRGRTPDTVDSWKEIPVVPTAAFRELDLSCGPAEKTFITSGTTKGPQKRGRHHVMRLDLYRASILPNFSDHLLPDGAKLRMLILTGAPDTWDGSSLAHMMDVVRREFGAEDSDYYINASGLEEDRLISDLKSCIRENRAVFLLGVTLAFYQLIERCGKEGLRFNLPAGSRIMDTGGFKGRKISLSREILYGKYRDILGVPTSHIVNEYGMTEMGSQFYDTALLDFFRGRSGPRIKAVPPWVRTLVVDPETLKEVPEGKTGILRHYDLANCGSVLALQTEDMGRKKGNGFELLGRAEGSPARGCSLLMDEFLNAPTARLK